jgi:hypothetical protein
MQKGELVMDLIIGVVVFGVVCILVGVLIFAIYMLYTEDVEYRIRKSQNRATVSSNPITVVTIPPNQVKNVPSEKAAATPADSTTKTLASTNSLKDFANLPEEMRHALEFSDDLPDLAQIMSIMDDLLKDQLDTHLAPEVVKQTTQGLSDRLQAAVGQQYVLLTERMKLEQLARKAINLPAMFATQLKIMLAMERTFIEMFAAAESKIGKFAATMLIAKYLQQLLLDTGIDEEYVQAFTEPYLLGTASIDELFTVSGKETTYMLTGDEPPDDNPPVEEHLSTIDTDIEKRTERLKS